MATVSQWTPFGVSLNVTATAGTVTRTSATTFTVVIYASWETYWSGSSTNYEMVASSGGGSATINGYGNYASSGSGSFTGTYSISGYGAQTKTISVTFTNRGSSGSSSTSVSLSVSVPALTSYTVSFNANGGSGAPSSQTKYKGVALTLSSTKPTRDGYDFLGWAVGSSATSATYTAGGSYTANSSVTLYAVWLLVEIPVNIGTITYDLNRGFGDISDQPHIAGSISILPSGKPTRNNYVFLGWSEDSKAKKAKYLAGKRYKNDDIEDGEVIKLYAVWKKKRNVYVNLPNGGSVNAIYVNVPDGSSIENIYYQIESRYIVQPDRSVLMDSDGNYLTTKDGL